MLRNLIARQIFANSFLLRRWVSGRRPTKQANAHKRKQERFSKETSAYTLFYLIDMIKYCAQQQEHKKLKYKKNITTAHSPSIIGSRERSPNRTENRHFSNYYVAES